MLCCNNPDPGRVPCSQWTSVMEGLVHVTLYFLINFPKILIQSHKRLGQRSLPLSHIYVYSGSSRAGQCQCLHNSDFCTLLLGPRSPAIAAFLGPRRSLQCSQAHVSVVPVPRYVVEDEHLLAVAHSRCAHPCHGPALCAQTCPIHPNPALIATSSGAMRRVLGAKALLVQL